MSNLNDLFQKKFKLIDEADMLTGDLRKLIGSFAKEAPYNRKRIKARLIDIETQTDYLNLKIDSTETMLNSEFLKLK